MSEKSQSLDIIMVNTRHISCDGGEEELGHPKVYYEIKSDINEVYCNYCGRHFLYKEKN